MARPIGRAGAALLGTLGPLLALELALRLFGPFLPGNYDTGTYLVRHPSLGHFHVPGFDGWIKSREFTTHVQISPLGLRDKRTSYTKPPGTYRILFLGDSIVEAVQVQANEAISERLEVALSQSASGRPVEVVNGGVAAYGTGQEYLLLDQEGVKYQPDLVILLFFVGNDVTNNDYRLELWDSDLRLALKPYFDLEPDGSLRLIPGPPPTPPSGLAQRLRDCCALYNVLETGVMNKLNREYPREQLEAIGGLKTPLRGLYDARPEGEWLRAWRISEALLARVRDRAAEMGARLVIVGAPEWRTLDVEAWRREVEGNRLSSGRLDAAAPTDQLGAIARQLGVPYVDLLPPLQQATSGGIGPLYYDFDKHWTATGHAVAAGAIERALREWGLDGR
ncbi:MAG TPA: SGNH/GDSL hydrolase family protein [Chloroflexota bacterium]|nr:SGNH/GDSL hydrolase family protein [Chloroflexota bacterium]